MKCWNDITIMPSCIEYKWNKVCFFSIDKSI